jgi:sugar phosphate isomerase/epimerase
MTRRARGRGFKSLQAHMMLGATLWYGHFRERGLKGAEERLHQAKSMGFDYIEFSPDYPLLRQLEPVRARQLAEMLESTGLKAAVHLPWDLHLADPRPEIHDGSLQVAERCMDLARELGALYANFHMGMSPLNLATFRFQEVRDDVIRTSVESSGRIASMGDERSIPVTIENVMFLSGGKLSHIEIILEKNPGLKFCFDPGHVMIANWNIQAAGEGGAEELPAWFSRLGSRMLTGHAHDILVEKGRCPIDHLAFGRGSSDINGILGSFRKTPCEHILLEMFHSDASRNPITGDELKESLDIAKKALT